jgi:hypothetical protein
MRAVLAVSALLLLIAVAPAQADTWSIKEGVCYDWVGDWTVSKTSPGVWTGVVSQRHVGGPCVQANGSIKTANIRVIMAGNNFSAQMVGASDNNNCAYNGSINGDQIVGTYVCPAPAGIFSFTINR